MRAANQNSDRLTYWHAGGSILLRGQPIARTDAMAIPRAHDLIGFYSREALSCSRKGDPEGARYCGTMAEELIFAVKAAGQWRRAATPRAA